MQKPRFILPNRQNEPGLLFDKNIILQSFKSSRNDTKRLLHGQLLCPLRFLKSGQYCISIHKQRTLY